MASFWHITFNIMRVYPFSLLKLSFMVIFHVMQHMSINLFKRKKIFFFYQIGINLSSILTIATYCPSRPMARRPLAVSMGICTVRIIAVLYMQVILSIYKW